MSNDIKFIEREIACNHCGATNRFESCSDAIGGFFTCFHCGKQVDWGNIMSKEEILNYFQQLRADYAKANRKQT